MPTIAEAGPDMAAIFDKALPMAAEDMEGGEETPPETPDAAPARETTPPSTPEKPVAEPKQPPKTGKTPVEPKEAAVELPDFLFGDKKPEEVVPETAPEPVLEQPPKELKGPNREHFKRLAQAKYETDKKAHALEVKLAEAESKAAAGDPTAKARIEALEKQVSAHSELVARANLELHPEFQARYTVPRQQAMEVATTALKDADGDVGALESALALKGKARAEKLNEIYEGVTNKFLLGKLERAVDQIEVLDQNKEVVMQHASVYNKQLEEAQAAQKAKQSEEYEASTRSALKEANTFLKDKYGLEVLQTVDDPKYGWWNEQAKKISDTAESIMLKISDPKQLTIAAHLAAACVPYRTMFRQEREQRIKLENQLKDLRGSEPGLGGEGRIESGGEEEEDENTPLATSIIKSIKGFERKGL